MAVVSQIRFGSRRRRGELKEERERERTFRSYKWEMNNHHKSSREVQSPSKEFFPGSENVGLKCSAIVCVCVCVCVCVSQAAKHFTRQFSETTRNSFDCLPYPSFYAAISWWLDYDWQFFSSSLCHWIFQPGRMAAKFHSLDLRRQGR